jgi:hypothetical protein
MSAPIVSEVTIVKMLSQISYDISWTGNPTGTFAVQVSNTYTQDSNGNVVHAGNWDTLPLSAPTAAAGAPGNGFIDIFGTGSHAMRMIYTPISGTGVLSITISAKVA